MKKLNRRLIILSLKYKIEKNVFSNIFIIATIYLYFLYPLQTFSSDPKNNKILFSFGGTLKTDIKIKNRIISVIDSSYYSGPNQGAPVESGMKYYSTLAPKLNIGIEYYINKARLIKLVANIIYENKSQKFMEANLDPKNDNSSIKYSFNYLQFALGVGYKLRRLDFNILGKYNHLLNKSTVFYSKQGNVFKSDNFSSGNSVYPNDFSFEINILYSILNKYKLKPYLGLTYEPIFKNSDAHTIGIQLVLKSR